MDNQTIDVVSEGEAGILHALQIIWSAACPGGKATHYKILKLRKDTRYYARQVVTDGNVDGIKNMYVHHCSDMREDQEQGVETLILLWHEDRGSTKLPYPLNQQQAAKFIHDWLGSVDFGRQPDHDGDNGRGWRLFTEAWGHVAGHHYAIVGVQPAWAMYGK